MGNPFHQIPSKVVPREQDECFAWENFMFLATKG